MHELRAVTYRTASDLEIGTGYTVLGQIPLVPGRMRKDVIGYLCRKPTSAAAEAVRNLRTSVLLSNTDRSVKVIATSSSLPEEGKTTTAFALAQNFTGLGQRVLLIEGDIRRRIFGAYMETAQKDGLLAVISGKRKLEDVVMKDPRIQADILVSEVAKMSATDLFASDGFALLMREVRKKYDTVIIDTPSVLLVPDARVIAQHVDAMLFVVAWDKTSKQQVAAALQMFESINSPVTGLVLNQIDPKGMKRYGHGGKNGIYGSYDNKYYIN